LLASAIHTPEKVIQSHSQLTMTTSSFYDKKCRKIDMKYLSDIIKKTGIYLQCTNNILVLAIIHHHLAMLHAVECWAFQKKKLSRLIKRKCQTVTNVFSELGNETLFCHAYRMTKSQCYNLYMLLKGKMQVSNKHVCQRTPNVPIENVVWLACTICYFAGGKSYDIACMFGISHAAFYWRCIWIVVDAIHQCEELNIQYPSSHAEQRKIAKGFQKWSLVGIKICAGAIDGLLVWIEKTYIIALWEAKMWASQLLLWPKGKVWI